ncbi:hypothetical protein [Neolewinella persica]|uniref:hypothetical protein n=1 Tax=Neolewinella persica TaxID=70998 RepID=UPI0003677E70|nr:hypothetical protein [Neolewinella persica]
MKHPPNFFRLNYNHGRTHSGMIAYLVELWNAGKETREPLRQFLAGLGVKDFPPHERYIAQLEYNNIDLAIWKYPYDKGDKPLLLLEMKVDDHEGRKSSRKKEWKGKIRQTEAYLLRNRHENCSYLFVTLGLGEHYEDFVCPEESNKPVWQWLKLEHFAAAAASAAKSLSDDQLLTQWAGAMAATLEDYRNPWGEPNTDERRAALYRLANLRKLLRARWQQRDELSEVTPSLYARGPRDTILHFRMTGNGPLFCEINSNGRLNFKIAFPESMKDANTKIRAYRALADALKDQVPELKVKSICDTAKPGATKTLASLVLGLRKGSLQLSDEASLDSVIDQITIGVKLCQAIKNQSP